ERERRPHEISPGIRKGTWVGISNLLRRRARYLHGNRHPARITERPACLVDHRASARPGGRTMVVRRPPLGATLFLTVRPGMLVGPPLPFFQAIVSAFRRRVDPHPRVVPFLPSVACRVGNGI